MSAADMLQPADAAVRPTALPIMVLTVEEAADVARCCSETIRRAIRKTVDDGLYPPPLPVAGRHGSRGQYLIWPDDLRVWLTGLVRFVA